MISLSLVTRVIALLSVLFFGQSALAQAGVWPRQITDAKGVHTLERPPERIVSTSVTLTGSLLAIDAPVIASGATTPGNNVADENGFFRQWGDIATQRHVQRLYIGEANVEAVAAQMPDLILLSATGGDSALALYSQLRAIAPTLVINYDDKSWQQLLTELGRITGHEQQAGARIMDFNTRLEKVRAQLTLPAQPISALVYTPAAHSANLWTAESAHGQLLKQLGFTLATLPSDLHTSQRQGKRRDIIQAGGENLSQALNGNAFLLFANNSEDAQALMNDPLLAHLPAIQQHSVWALGNETFRLDYYSASLVLDRLNKLFGKP